MRLLVTAGPTREYMDPVRFISNRSSGKMGYAIAAAARDRGHEVVLVSGPVAIQAPARITVIPVVSAADMFAAVEAQLDSCDALIMAAAVADWRPAEVSGQKVKKLKSGPELRLEPTADILQTIKSRKGGRVFVGFAAETTAVEAEARRKLGSKGLDMIVANDVSQPDAGFDVDTNRVVLITGEGAPRALPLMTKREVGARIVEWVEGVRGQKSEIRDPKSGVPSPPALGLGEAGKSAGDLAGDGRLAKQLEFIREIDKLKSVYRRTLLMDGTRHENDAEHSWHLAVMAVLLKEHANVPQIDLIRVVKMVLVHDIVEIDAGDTYCYDDKGNVDKVARERVAATRLFGILPGDQARELWALWEEFEARETPEAKYAAALDRVQPLMHNYHTHGVVWKKNGVRSGKVRERNRHVEEGSRPLWKFAEAMIQSAVEHGELDE